MLNDQQISETRMRVENDLLALLDAGEDPDELQEFCEGIIDDHVPGTVHEGGGPKKGL